INDLQIASEHPDEVFVEEILLAHETLSTDKFNDLINRIEYGLLGGIHDPNFAVTIIKVVLNTYISENITEIQKKYINELVNDIKNKKQESFGLFEALKDNDFQEQFLAFSQSTY
ncbi:31193_t:CDS:2, partial [Racocetra persica]